MLCGSVVVGHGSRIARFGRTVDAEPTRSPRSRSTAPAGSSVKSACSRANGIRHRSSPEPGEVLAISATELREVVKTRSRPRRPDPARLSHPSLPTDRTGAGFRIIGSCLSPDTRRLREFAARNRLPHRWIDLEKTGRPRRCSNISVCRRGYARGHLARRRHILRNPGNADLAQLVGLRTAVRDGWRAICWSSAPARPASPPPCTPRRTGCHVSWATPSPPAGRPATSSRIENYLGFPSGYPAPNWPSAPSSRPAKFGALHPCAGEADRSGEVDGLYVVDLDDGTG